MRVPTTRLFPLGMMLVLAALTFYLDRAVNEEDTHPALRRHDRCVCIVSGGNIDAAVLAGILAGR